MLLLAGSLKVVLNEGFPQHRRPFDKGRLVIQFSVSAAETAGMCMSAHCVRFIKTYMSVFFCVHAVYVCALPDALVSMLVGGGCRVHWPTAHCGAWYWYTGCVCCTCLQVNFPPDNWITHDELKELESLLPPRPREVMRSEDSMAEPAEEVRGRRSAEPLMGMGHRHMYFLSIYLARQCS